MNTGSVRFLLLIMPMVLVVTWGLLIRTSELPFTLVIAVIAAVVFAIGTAARQSVRLKALAAAAAGGGVLSVVPGLPLAILAMVGGTNVGNFAIAIDGWAGVPPALVWSITAVTLLGGAALLCVVAALLGRQVRSRLIRND
jgi:hypothetical protein